MNTQTARDARTRVEWLWCAAVMLGALTLYLSTVSASPRICSWLRSGWATSHSSGAQSTRSCAGPKDVQRRTLRLAWAALCALAGASTYLYLPLRAAMSPKFSTIAPHDLTSFSYVLTGGPYAWFLRDYDRAARLVDVTAMLAAHLSTLGFVLGGLGLALLTLQKRTIGLALWLEVTGNLWFFFAYDVHDVEEFFLPSAAVFSVGIGPLLRDCKSRSHSPRCATPATASWHCL